MRTDDSFFFASITPAPLRRLAPSIALSLALAGCGGHGSDDTAPAPAQPLASVTLSGTTATGARIAASPVDVRCASGTGSTTTAADGTYTVTIAGGAFPCLARVTPTTGPVLYTVATSSGTTAIANITPATQLIVADLAALDLATYFAAFDSGHASAVTAAAIADAQAQVIGTLRLAGIDFTAVGDLLAAAFSSVYDTTLDTFSAALVRSGTTLDTLTTRFIAASSPSPVSVPAELLLQPAAITCGSLHSTSYRILTPTNGAPLAQQSAVVALNATTLTATRADGTISTWIANGSCRFSEQHGTYSADIVVSQAGVLTARYSSDGITYRTYIGFPEQTHGLAELAGDWNALGLSRSASNTYTGVAGGISFDATGRVTAASNCQNNATWAVDVCAALPATLLSGIVPLGVDSAGGFDSFDTTTLAVSGRLFAFKSGSGDVLLATVDTDGDLFLYATVHGIALPTVNTTTKNWNFDSLAQFTSASAVYSQSITITSVDTTASSWTRSSTPVGGTVSRPDSLFANNPRPGYIHRPSATVTASDGSTVLVNEYTALRLPGMGFAPLLLLTPTGKLFELSVTQP